MAQVPPAPTARQTPLTCNGHTRPVVDLHFNPDTTEGSFLLSAAKDGNPMLRDGQTGDWIGTYAGHKGAVWSGRLSRTGLRAVTGSADFSAQKTWRRGRNVLSKLWDARQGVELHTFSHKHIVRSVYFGPAWRLPTATVQDDQTIATGGQEKVLRLFDLNRPDAEPSAMATRAGASILSITSGANPNLLVTASDERLLRVWDMRTLSEVRTIATMEPVTSVEYSQARSVLTLAFGTTVSMRDAQTLEIVNEFTLPYKALSASLHPVYDRFVVGGADCHIRVHDATTGQELELYKGHHGPVHCIHYSPDGELYASGSEDGTIRLWQTVPGTAYGLWLGPAVEDAAAPADRRVAATA